MAKASKNNIDKPSPSRGDGSEKKKLIKLASEPDEFEVIEAVAQYCEKEHGINIDVDCIDGVSIEYQERERVFKKHKNGKTKMDEHGYPEVDWENSPSKTKYISLGEMSEMHISILSRDDI